MVRPPVWGHASPKEGKEALRAEVSTPRAVVEGAPGVLGLDPSKARAAMPHQSGVAPSVIQARIASSSRVGRGRQPEMGLDGMGLPSMDGSLTSLSHR